ncbi:uncharacterized protein C8A04DRAFT_16144 [Dichotomopilus funicola]|uniref:Uncharacterized protein n=1 Tax=Dichotomopilus funicola TaxID=1934379 RepID=A0AAN6UUD6_9PEZI|nr:hypothetical protein C8A04DRAFT_16144 [Dichotomopilus funicola]
MGSKRNHSSSTGEPGSSCLPNKRRREQQNTKSKPSEGKPDPTYGQRAAFPGLDDEGCGQISDEDLEFEENSDALAYLRAVRQEANGVPNVLVAPRAGPQLPPHLQDLDAIDRSIYADGVGDSRGYYQDGAYTAAPDPDPLTDSSVEDEQDDRVEEGDGSKAASSFPRRDRVAAQNAALRRAYFSALIARFLNLRTILHRTPPPTLVTALPRDHGVEVGSFGPRSWTFRVWSRRFRHTDPLPAQVAALDRQGALRLLRVLLGGKFIRRGYELRPRTSRWIWALLARLPDSGEMDYAEVGWVRELGKRAVLMMVSMAQMEALQEEVEEDLEGEMNDNGEEEQEEEFLGELVVDEDAERGVAVSTTTGLEKADTTEADNGHCEIADDQNEDGEMDMDLDEGEVTDDDQPAVPAASSNSDEDLAADIAAAKARLLARLEAGSSTNENQHPEHEQQEQAGDDLENEEGEWEPTENSTLDEAEARANMRATLNMILTVAGEFYGQRDLLEFRDPFPAQ